MNPPAGQGPEQPARETIDAVLAKAGWEVQDRDEIDFAEASDCNAGIPDG